MLKIPLDTTDGIYRYVGYVSHVPVGADPCVCPGREAVDYITKNYDVYYMSCAFNS